MKWNKLNRIQFHAEVSTERGQGEIGEANEEEKWAVKTFKNLNEEMSRTEDKDEKQ